MVVLSASSYGRNSQKPDRFSWIDDANGVYTAKDTHRLLCEGEVEFSMHKHSGTRLPPSTAKKNLLAHAQISALDFGQEASAHPIGSYGVCFTFLQEEDTVDHVLMQCPYSRRVWFECLVAASAGLNIFEPGRDSSSESRWSVARELVHKKDRKGFDTLVILMSWLLWKQRNTRIFNNISQQCNV